MWNYTHIICLSFIFRNEIFVFLSKAKLNTMPQQFPLFFLFIDLFLSECKYTIISHIWKNILSSPFPPALTVFFWPSFQQNFSKIVFCLLPYSLEHTQNCFYLHHYTENAGQKSPLTSTQLNPMITSSFSYFLISDINLDPGLLFSSSKLDSPPSLSLAFPPLLILVLGSLPFSIYSHSRVISSRLLILKPFKNCWFLNLYLQFGPIWTHLSGCSQNSSIWMTNWHHNLIRL